MSTISLLWQIPLGILSFLFYRISKYCIAKVFTRAVKKGKQQNRQWRCISMEVLKTPFMLPFIATQGPRWNPHAVITNIGPFPVQGDLQINLEEVSQSAKNWTLVIYSHPDYKTIKSIGANNYKDKKNSDSLLTDIHLSPGVYSLSIRYYEWKDNIAFPGLYSEGKTIVETRWISGHVNEFYHFLIELDSLWYRAMQYHIYPLLKIKHLLSQKQHQKLFLPVGNPDTRFQYDWIKSGQKLTANIPAAALSDARLYVCIYNKSSFPIDYFSITDNEFSYISKKDGYYLFRLCSNIEEDSDKNIAQLSVSKQ